MPKPLLVVTLRNHWSIKNLVHTGALTLLQESFQIEVWCDAGKIEPIKSLCSKFCDEDIIWKANLEIKETFKHKFWRLLQKSLLFEHHELATEAIIQKSHRGNRNRSQNFLSGVAKWVAKSRFGDRAIQIATRNRESLISNHLVNFSEDPAVVFITNPVDFREDLVAMAANQMQTPVVTMIPSWDNLSSKGVLLSIYDRIFVWNEMMKVEVLNLYPAFECIDIDAIGVPRFDVHQNSPNGEFSREALLSGLGLSPDKATILYANTATSSFPQQIQVIKHIIEACRNGEIENSQVLVRCHPHDDVSQYEQLNEEGLVAVWPKASDAKRAFGVEAAPPVDDLIRLTAMIKASDVVVNAASTIVLDAACCDKPIISVAYDGDEKPVFYDSIVSAYDYTHQKFYLESMGGVLVKSKAELISEVNIALINPFLRTVERKQLGHFVTRGSATHQMVKLLEGYLP